MGECANLSVRFNAGYGNISPKNCFKGGQETNCRLNNLLYLAAAAGMRIRSGFFERPYSKIGPALLEEELSEQMVVLPGC